MEWDFYMMDVVDAIRAADTQAKRHGREVYIMPDLSIVLPEHATEPPLEIVKYVRGGFGEYRER